MSNTPPVIHQLPSPARLFYLDNLRSFIVLVVIVFHVAMGFMAFVPAWWPVIDTQQNLFFTGVVLLTDVPIMPIMFLIAGYFAIASLVGKGQVAFWKDKLLRIVLPWVLGFLVIAPLSPYMWLVSRHKNPAFTYFWRHMFFTKTFNTQGALWFLGVLTVFYLALSIAYSLHKPLGNVSAKLERPGWVFFSIFLLVTSAVFVFVNQFWHDFTWVPVRYILWVQPTRVSLEAFYFALGVYAYRRQWFGREGYRPETSVWTVIATLTGIIFLSYKLHFGVLMPQLPVRIGHGLLHCLFCMSTTFALLGAFRTWWNKTSWLLAKLAESSYAIYWVHMPIVLLSGLAIRGFHWNIYVKYLAASTLAVVGSFLIAAYGLLWLPMFAGKRKARTSLAVPNYESAGVAESSVGTRS